MTLLTKAQHASACKVSKAAVSQWAAAGKLVMVGNLVDHESSYRGEAWHASSKAARREPKAPSSASASVRRPARPRQALTLTRAQWLARLLALDWTLTPDLSDEAQARRVIAAAFAVGLEAVKAPAQDGISLHGGWQLRNVELVRLNGGPCTDAVNAGFGFELDDHNALWEARECIAHPDDDPDDLAEPLTLDPEAVVLLAYPLSQHHRQPRTD